MTPPQYILDPRFQVHGCAFQWGDTSSPFWLDEHQLQPFFDTLPDDTIMVTFNALFDMCIAEWRYGYMPALALDAMGMARALIGPNRLRSFSLASVAQHFELGAKGDAIINTQGYRTEDLVANQPLYESLVEYSKNDVLLTRKIYDRLSAQFPLREARFMDLVIRAAVEPQLVLDADVLRTHIANVELHKTNLMVASGCDKISLMSTAKFVAKLKALGIEVETKPSPSTGMPIPAIAKSDSFMGELLEHPDIDVQALVAARLGLRSTIEETRSKRLLAIAECEPTQHYFRCNVNMGAPIPLRYGAAHTHRLGGDWKINLQNLPRGSMIRYAIRAPNGCKVISADLAQIEARLSAWFSQENRLLGQFRNREDPYAALASAVFGYEVTKATHPVERFIGKTGVLGLGYGAGPPKFYSMVHQLAKQQLGKDIVFTAGDAERAVEIYRSIMYPQITARWNYLGHFVLPALADPAKYPSVEMIGGVYAAGGHITLPNGLRLCYDIKARENDSGFVDKVNGVDYNMYGAKLLENIIQALARIVLSDNALLLASGGRRFAMQVHDELVFVVDEDEVEYSCSVIRAIMTTPPQWAPELPLDVEINVGDTYGDCK